MNNFIIIVFVSSVISILSYITVSYYCFLVNRRILREYNLTYYSYADNDKLILTYFGKVLRVVQQSINTIVWLDIDNRVYYCAIPNTELKHYVFKVDAVVVLCEMIEQDETSYFLEGRHCKEDSELSLGSFDGLKVVRRERI